MHIKQLVTSDELYEMLSNKSIEDIKRKLFRKYDTAGINQSDYIREILFGMNVELEHGNKSEETDIIPNDPNGNDKLTAVFKVVAGHLLEPGNLRYYTKLRRVIPRESKEIDEKLMKKGKIKS